MRISQSVVGRTRGLDCCFVVCCDLVWIRQAIQFFAEDLDGCGVYQGRFVGFELLEGILAHPGLLLAGQGLIDRACCLDGRLCVRRDFAGIFRQRRNQHLGVLEGLGDCHIGGSCVTAFGSFNLGGGIVATPAVQDEAIENF